MEIVFAGSASNGRLNAKVLLLNQSFEPLKICSLKKAITLIFLQKAEVIIEDEIKKVRSVSMAFPSPSVIRLKRYVKVPFKSVVLSRKNVFRRDSFVCAYCGRGDRQLTIDHIVPKSLGGSNSWINLITACVSCNNKKGDRTPAEAGMELLFKPFVPSHIMFLKNSVNKIDPKWKPFLYLE